MHRALIHVLVGLIALLAEPGYFFFVARGRSVGHKTLRQPKQMALFFGRINLQSSRFESKTMLLNVKKCYPIPSSSAKSLGASVFFCFFLFFVLLVKHISWSIFIQLDPVGVSQSTEGSQFRKWVSDTSAPARSQAFASVRAPGGWWCWCQGQKMPGASANHLGLDQNDQTFRALGGKKNFHPLSWASCWRPEDQNETRNNQEPAKRNHPQVMCILHFGHPFGLHICTMYTYTAYTSI